MIMELGLGWGSCEKIIQEQIRKTLNPINQKERKKEKSDYFSTTTEIKAKVVPIFLFLCFEC